VRKLLSRYFDTARTIVARELLASVPAAVGAVG
jgi:hypothetical protein